MQRTYLVAAVAIVAILAVVWLLPGSAEEEGPNASPFGAPAALGPEDGGAAQGRGPSLHAGLPPPPRTVAEQGEDEPEALPPHGPFAFRVRSAESDLPLAEVTLRTLPEPDESETVLGVTDEEGELQIEWPHAATLPFHADKEGYVRHRDLARAEVPIEIRLFPGVEIRGRVVRAPGGAPVASATVHVFDEDSRTEVAASVTDAKGRFRIAAVRPHHPMTLVASAPGLVPTVRRENFAGPVEDLELRVGGGSTLRVRVRTAKERPAPDLPVTLDVLHEALPEGALPDGAAWAERDRALALTLPTDEEGRCRFEGIPRGVVAVATVRVTERLRVRGRRTRFERDGLEAEDLIRLPEAATLTVRVVDEAGSPVPEAELDLVGPRGALPVRPGDRRGAGLWTFADLAPGEYAVLARVRAAPTRSERVALKPAQIETFDLVVPRGSSIRGQVEDKRGRPIWRAQVSWNSTDRKRPERASTVTDSKGAFVLRRLTGAIGTLAVNARDVPVHPFGFESKAVEDVAPGAGRVRVVLDDTTRVTGHFPDLPDGTDVRMRMIPGTARDDAPVWLDEQRRFRRRGPSPEGGPTLFAFRTGRLPPLLVLEKRPFDREEARDLGPLFFEDTNPRLGRVVGSDGRPLRGARVDVDEPWSTQYARTDAQGDFAFGRLPDQPVRIRVAAEEHMTKTVRLEPLSQYQRQVIELPPAGRVEGVLVDPRRRPVGRAQVAILQAQGRGRRRQLESKGAAEVSDGRFGLDLPPGAYVLRVLVSQDPRPPLWAEKEIMVVRGQTARVALQLRYGSPKWEKR